MSSYATRSLRGYLEYCYNYMKGRAVQPHKQFPTEKTVFEFNNPEKLADWVHSSDADFGGLSKASFVYTGKRSALFSGSLSDELPEGSKLQNTGYAAIRSKLPTRVLWHQPMIDMSTFDHLVLHAKGDHNQWLVNIQTDTWYTGTLWQHKLVFQKPGEWETVKIPLRDFVLTIQGRLAKRQVLMNHEKIKTIGFSVIRQPGPFSLDIKSIKGWNSIQDARKKG